MAAVVAVEGRVVAQAMAELEERLVAVEVAEVVVKMLTMTEAMVDVVKSGFILPCNKGQL